MTVKEESSIMLGFSYRSNGFGTKSLVQGIGITATCKQIRSESLPLLFSTNSFVLDSDILSDLQEDYDEAGILHGHVSKQTQAIEDWLKAVGEGVKYLRRVTVELGEWDVVEEYPCDWTAIRVTSGGHSSV
ncbi:hypothetical protein LTR37_009272 [Vermiconidia calcicola]|uniref:Uncharacterized protein n=1 Tax=Vermiconidia calcicola TaxID=1690605 RepID=A0ACC3N9C6_9PEZI|nr:hypothetical protein LTR37_009272 [Vermiconidia calcicola]